MQAGSCWRTVSKTFRASVNQYECSMATPRSNVVWTFGSQDVGNVTLPSLSPWARAVTGSATVHATTSSAWSIFMAFLRGRQPTIRISDESNAFLDL